MKICEKLCEEAQNVAANLARRNGIRYSSGENIYVCTRTKSLSSTSAIRECCFKAVDSWYREIENYSFETSKKLKKNQTIAHFQQMVWRDSVRLGFGIAQRRDGNIIIICRYSPRANVFRSKINAKQIMPVQTQ
ncbi:Oidioi.mRNA.OKI2018_I69.chr1.g3643.t1.cds [Oikopleura dioica]|uniref:Oidioi.mRNA.OKI2018_I69.chr1.g3643.t1.cds n=1 Tax=Oikopleura dioica TaxID=34765 RepID=A0ABN7T0A9_OIKDI|nr:Oidioi.mRNA.OKI2018_I69.chr1.g3643.t1.cds [Oikopleura dioica]